MDKGTDTLKPNYVLVTPAKNEETAIGSTIRAVLSQTVKPAEWMIVSDGSSDRTDDIVRTATELHSWIRLLALPPRAHRSFEAVVRAIEAGVRALRQDIYEYIGLLDADVCFEPDYFERLIAFFEASPGVGLAGGMVIDTGLPKGRLPRNRNDVPGAAQFFRRRCFEELGGLIAIPEGGWDALTCARARMRGYETRLLTHLVVNHLKPRNLSEGGMLRRQWQLGVRDCALGYRPLFEVVKCLSRLSESPLLVGAMARAFGFCFAAIQPSKRMIPTDLLEFLRAEQKRRLLRELLPFRKGPIASRA